LVLSRPGLVLSRHSIVTFGRSLGIVGYYNAEEW
jgi:hypothetical protein